MHRKTYYRRNTIEVRSALHNLIKPVGLTQREARLAKKYQKYLLRISRYPRPAPIWTNNLSAEAKGSRRAASKLGAARNEYEGLSRRLP
jgi:hypothetical protein